MRKLMILFLWVSLGLMLAWSAMTQEVTAADPATQLQTIIDDPNKEINRVMAVVGDEIITLMNVEKLLSGMESGLVAAARAKGQNLPSRGELHRLALDRLIEDSIFDQAVRKERITASDEEVNLYINRIKQSNNLTDEGFAAQLSRRGLTPEEYREELKRDILKNKLVERAVKSRIVISDVQVEEYFKGNNSQYQAMDQIHFRALFLNLPDDASPIIEDTVKSKIQNIYEQARQGADFAGLALEYSEGPGASNGGELGPVSSADLLPNMRQALAELKAGDICKPIKIPGNYVFMQMLDRKGAESPELTEEMKAQIRTKLENEALEKRFQEWMKQVRSQVFVQIIK